MHYLLREDCYENPYLEILKKGYILFGYDALDWLALMDQWVDDDKIRVYALEKGNHPYIDYHIVDSYDNIDYEVITAEGKYTGIKVSKPIQAINELYKEYGEFGAINICTALYNLYFNNQESWENLGLEKCIIPKKLLEEFKKDAELECELK